MNCDWFTPDLELKLDVPLHEIYVRRILVYMIILYEETEGEEDLESSMPMIQILRMYLENKPKNG